MLISYQNNTKNAPLIDRTVLLRYTSDSKFNWRIYELFYFGI